MEALAEVLACSILWHTPAGPGQGGEEETHVVTCIIYTVGSRAKLVS